MPKRALYDTEVFRDCPYCKASNYEVVYSGGSIPTQSRLETSDFNLVSCRSCKTIYVNPAPLPDSLISYYPADYYSQDTDTPPGFIDRFNRNRSFLRRQIRKWLAETSGRWTTSEKRVFEVGCATGDNLEPFIQAGWKAYAIEPNRALAGVANSKGVEVHIGLSNSFRWENEKFDVILLNHVLEHDHDPRMILEKCVHSLKLGGALYVEIPVVETPSWNLFGRYWGELEFPVHLTLMRKEHLITLIEQLGCRPIVSKTRTLLGTTLRTVEKIPRFKVSTGTGRIFILSCAMALQSGFMVLNTLLRQGEAFSVVARRESTLGIWRLTGRVDQS